MILVYVKNNRVYFKNDSELPVKHADEWKEGELTEADYKRARERKPRAAKKTAIIKTENGGFTTKHFPTEAEAHKERLKERYRRYNEYVKKRKKTTSQATHMHTEFRKPRSEWDFNK